MGRDSSDDIATPYGLDSYRDRISVRTDLRTRPDWFWSPSSLLYNGYRVLPGAKATGAWSWPPIPSSAEVKERVKVHLYSPSGPSWSVLGQTLHFIFWTKLLCLQPSTYSSWLIRVHHNYAHKLKNLLGLNEKEHHDGSFVHRNQ